MQEEDLSEEEIAQLAEEYEQGFDVPRNPGPAALGHTPLVGTVRRQNGVPVVRERVVEELDELDAVDIRNSPLLPAIRTNR